MEEGFERPARPGGHAGLAPGGYVFGECASTRLGGHQPRTGEAYLEGFDPRGNAGTKSLGLVFADTGLRLPQNFSVVSEFITPHGRIKKRSITGLKPKNQRKVAKMVRRAIGLGIHPSVHRHPELLMREGQMSQAQTSVTPFKGSYV